MEDVKNSRRLKRNVDRARMIAAQANEKSKKDKANEENKNKKKRKCQKPVRKAPSNTVMMKSNTQGLSSSVSDSSSSSSGSGEINVFNIFIMSHIYYISKSNILIHIVFIR